jgi:DNA-binding transcriptional LysR family regulator
MNPRQIEAFKRVIENGTVTVAAEAMHVSQPAVTKLLQAFERAAGFKLFVRERGRLVPTPDAKLLYKDVHRLFAATEEVRRSADDIRTLRKGALVVGAMPALSTGFVQQVAALYLARYPGINLVVHTAPRLKLIDSVTSRTLDVALCHSLPDHPEIDTRVFSREPAVCLLPRRHPLARRKHVEARDLAGLPFISWTEGSPSRARVDGVFDALGIQRELRFAASTSPAICAYVAAGLGVALMHPLYIGTASAAVAVRPFAPRLEFSLLIAYPRVTPQLRSVRAFCELVESESLRSVAAPAFGRKPGE